MTVTEQRNEIHNLIDVLPEKYLVALKPLLELLAGPLHTIEPASPEEAAMIDGRMKDYERDPSSFIPWSEVKKGQAKAKKVTG